MRKPLRILRLTPHFFREGVLPVAFDPVGGLQTQVWRLSERLAEAGHRQTILTSHIPGFPRRDRPHPAVDMKAVGPSPLAFLAGPLLSFFWCLGVLPHLFRWPWHYDVVHIHFNHSVWCRILAVVASWAGGPVVVSLNTALWGGLGALMTKAGFGTGLTHIPERWALAATDQIVALTAFDADAKATALQVSRSRFEVVPDAIDAAAFGEPPDPADVARFRQRHGIPGDRPIVSYVGRISSEKGWQDLPILMPAVERADAFILIAGDGPCRRALEASLKTLDRGHRWCVTGFLSPRDVRVALHLSTVLVLPSRREAFGSVLLEAMATAVPAVAYAIGGVPEVAGVPPAIRLVPAEDTAAFAAAVAELLADPTERSELAARGRNRLGSFGIDQSAGAMEAIYARLVETREGRLSRS